MFLNSHSLQNLSNAKVSCSGGELGSYVNQVHVYTLYLSRLSGICRLSDFNRERAANPARIAESAQPVDYGRIASQP